MKSELEQRIESTIQSSKVVLFMKGSKLAPSCGFSSRVVSILTRNAVDFVDVDVLVDPELREGLKHYSNWPTFPQLYVRGRLVGGADIVSKLHETGELARLLAD
jgi:monothiol glutaredoxin